MYPPWGYNYMGRPGPWFGGPSTGGPASMASFGVEMEEEYDDDMWESELDNEADSRTINPEEIEADDEQGGGEDNDLLTAHRERYADEDGEPVKKSLAELGNNIWAKGKDIPKMMECYVKYPRPKNVVIHKVLLNEEVMSSIEKFGHTRDIKLRAAQAGVARAAVPMIRVIQNLMDGNTPLDKQQQVDMAIDGVSQSQC